MEFQGRREIGKITENIQGFSKGFPKWGARPSLWAWKYLNWGHSTANSLNFFFMPYGELHIFVISFALFKEYSSFVWSHRGWYIYQRLSLMEIKVLESRHLVKEDIKTFGPTVTGLRSGFRWKQMVCCDDPRWEQQGEDEEDEEEEEEDRGCLLRLMHQFVTFLLLRVCVCACAHPYDATPLFNLHPTTVCVGTDPKLTMTLQRDQSLWTKTNDFKWRNKEIKMKNHSLDAK